MRRLIARRAGVLLLLAWALAVSGCKRAHHPDALIPESEPVVLASEVKVSDPDASAQLTHGFYQLEDNAWRWTAKKFTVALKTPPGAAQKGGQLSLHYNFPEVVSQKLGAVKITAKIGGAAIGSQLLKTPGDGVFSAEVPAGLLAADTISVDFECDKALPPAGDDVRELALVVTSIGLESR